MMIKIEKNFMRAFILLHIFFYSCSWETNYKASAKRSIQSDTDLILVPYPFNIFDKSSRDNISLSHYGKEELENILSNHELSWENLIKEWGWDEKEQSFSKEVNYTSHYTNYYYDANIPIWIYGPRWFKTGMYPDKIFQQHIPSIYAKLLRFDFTNNIDLSDYKKIFNKTSEIPEIIVTIVIDQGGEQLYKAHPNSFPFLTSLKENSAYFKNARLGHLEAHTAVGHAAIGTGKFPAEMNVFSNEIYSWKEGKVIGRSIYQADKNTLNLDELNTLTLSDEWDRENDNLPVIVSQCYAARASIGMAGHGNLIPNKFSSLKSPDKDFVYWENPSKFRWDTFSQAFSVPDSLNTTNLYNFYIDHKTEKSAIFNAENQIEFLKKIHYFQGSEYQVILDKESFLKVVKTEIIDKNKHFDGKTDLTYLTLKATDAVGHLFGWESKEADTILRSTDREIEKIFDFLKSIYGDRFVLLITADHGAVPMPEVSRASFLTHDHFFSELSLLLPESERQNKSVVKWVTHSQLSFNRSVMAEYQITEQQVTEKIKSLNVNGKPFFRKVWTREELN